MIRALACLFLAAAKNLERFTGIAILVAALMWRSTGSVGICAVLWGLLLIQVFKFWRFRDIPLSVAVLATMAFICNATALWGNGGHMPALASVREISDAGRGYIMLTADCHFWYLGDCIHHCSVGDLFVFGSVVAWILMRLLPKRVTPCQTLNYMKIEGVEPFRSYLNS